MIVLIDYIPNNCSRHLPYSRAAQDFMLEQPKKSKKRVSIIPAGQSGCERERILPIPQITEPEPFVTSPERERGDLIELSRLGTGHSLDDMHSISSEDSFNDHLLLDKVCRFNFFYQTKRYRRAQQVKVAGKASTTTKPNEIRCCCMLYYNKDLAEDIQFLIWIRKLEKSTYF